MQFNGLPEEVERLRNGYNTLLLAELRDLKTLF